MKFISVFLFALLAVQSTVAHPAPEPFFFDALSDLTQKLGDAAQGVIDGKTGLVTGGIDAFHGAVKGGIEAGAGIAKGVIGGVTGVVAGAANSMAEVTKAVENAIKNTVGQFTNNIIKRAASTFQNQVKNIQQRAEKVIQTADEVTAEVRDKVDAMVEKAKDGINDFAVTLQNKAAGAPEEAQDKIQELIDQFVDESSEKIDECANGIIAPVEELNAKARDTVQDSFPVIDEVLQAIKDCAELNQRDHRSVSECAKDIKEKASGLKSLPGQYADLLRQLARVSSSTVTRSPCVASVTGDLIEKRKALSAEIQKLIKNE